MNNLIVTIISIALVAVAAIMGTYYAGAAFNNSNTQVIANTIQSCPNIVQFGMFKALI